MNSFKFHSALFISCILLFSCSNHSESDQHESEHHEHKQAESDVPKENKIEVLKIENLLRDSLALADNVEIVVSYLEIPENTTLPTHYHPGEEFVYMLEGSGEITLGDDPSKTISAGEFVKVPFKQVHSFSTFDEQARAVVFRVHEEGQPDRILVE
jgi:quercetin dioxygenase-like cupin family protein